MEFVLAFHQLYASTECRVPHCIRFKFKFKFNTSFSGPQGSGKKLCVVPLFARPLTFATATRTTSGNVQGLMSGEWQLESEGEVYPGEYYTPLNDKQRQPDSYL